MKALLRILLGCLFTILIAGASSATGQSAEERATDFGEDKASLHPTLAKDALRSVRIALQWLEQQQTEDGHWSNPQFPAITALVVWAHLRSPDVISVDERGWQHVKVYDYVQRSINYILSCVQEDGGIYRPVERGKGGGLKNYNTAICMAALTATGDIRYEDVVQRARGFLIDLQYLDGGAFDGGMGYDAASDRAYADLSNTYVAIEAIRFTEFIRYAHQVECLPPQDYELLRDLKKLRDEAEKTGQKEKTLNWDRAIKFVARCQNLPKTNGEPWVSRHSDDRGGFVYHPGKSMAGERIVSDGSRYLRSYGSMTYAGLLSFIYAEVDRNDQRVVAAYDWIRRHFTVDENPGMGNQGLYYNYHTMAKALTAYGEDRLQLPDGRTINWRRQLIHRLISLLMVDPKRGYGYCLNESGRWWENDPVLTTAYATLALEICLEGTAP